MARFTRFLIALMLVALVSVNGCANLSGLLARDAPSLLLPTFKRSEVFGFIAGLGTTFAAVPDLLAMLKRRSSAGMNPRMAAIMGTFQILWVYYGLLIISRPVILWNVVAVLINFLSVAAYFHYRRKEEQRLGSSRIAP
jgi:MtN3 and saliva related transmembrane protein